MRPALPISHQPDLFDFDARDEDGSDGDSSAVVPPRDYTDEDLIAAIPMAGLSNVDALCSEAVARSLAAAVPAFETLWQRFTGFGPNTPHRQQLAVIDTLARPRKREITCGAAADCALKDLARFSAARGAAGGHPGKARPARKVRRTSPCP